MSTKAARFSAAKELAAELSLTIGQALILLSGGKVSGRNLDEYRIYYHEDDPPFVTCHGLRYRFF